ncbi:phosphopantetheine-binding protein [Desulfovibrionales bacterium]
MNQNEQHILTLVAEILDCDPQDLSCSTYVIRELGAESIDLLEIGVGIQHHLGMSVDEDQMFLKNLRTLLVQAELAGQAPEAVVAKAYPHLSPERRAVLLADMADGPALQLADLIAYADWVQGQATARV